MYAARIRAARIPKTKIYKIVADSTLSMGFHEGYSKPVQYTLLFYKDVGNKREGSEENEEKDRTLIKIVK